MIDTISKIWLARHIVDFRCSHDGLLAHANRVGVKIFSGEAILFIGRDKKKLKLLFSDENGLWVAYKKFHQKGLKLRLEFLENPTKTKLTKAELKMLLSGASYISGGKPAPWP